jgi:hypothetical protein
MIKEESMRITDLVVMKLRTSPRVGKKRHTLEILRKEKSGDVESYEN